MKRKTMVDRIEQYMIDNGSITTWECFEELGSTRLSEYIRQLRFKYEIEGIPVTKINRYGEKVTFKKFKIVRKY